MHFSNSNCATIIFSSFKVSSVVELRNIFNIWLYVCQPSALRKLWGEMSLNRSCLVSVNTGAPTDEVCSLIDWLSDNVFNPKSPEFCVLIDILLELVLSVGDGMSNETFLASSTILSNASCGWGPPCLMYFSPSSTANRMSAVWIGENGGASWFKMRGSSLKNKTWAINFASAVSNWCKISTTFLNLESYLVTTDDSSRGRG